MSGHTKGRVIVDGTYVRHVESQTDVADCDMNGIPSSMARANAALIAESFNVAHDTGRTPAQLAVERAELVAAIKMVMQFIPDLLGEAGLTEEDEDWVGQLRAILAKVKGPVPS